MKFNRFIYSVQGDDSFLEPAIICSREAARLKRMYAWHQKLLKKKFPVKFLSHALALGELADRNGLLPALSDAELASRLEVSVPTIERLTRALRASKALEVTRHGNQHTGKFSIRTLLW